MIIPDKNPLSTFNSNQLGPKCDIKQHAAKPSNTTASLLGELVLCGYLKKAMGMGEVTVGMAALVELLQQSRDAMPLGPFISLLEQASWELQHKSKGNLKYCNTHSVWLFASVLQKRF